MSRNETFATLRSPEKQKEFSDLDLSQIEPVTESNSADSSEQTSSSSSSDNSNNNSMMNILSPMSFGGAGNIFSDEKIKELRKEYQIFWKYCGLDGNQRIYGRFEVSGMVANLKYNRFLKRSGTEDANPNRAASDVTSFTQEAFYVEVDEEVLQRQRDIDIINALPEGRRTTFRVKDIKYGNHNAMWEIMAGQLYGLTGLTAPDTRLLVHEDYGRRDNGAPKVYVASPTITGYSDIGDFLIDAALKRFIDPKSLPIWRKAKKQIEEINQKSREGKAVTAEDKMKRLDLMAEICDLMPEYFFTEIEKSFAASKFIGNWDFANLNLNNIGCRFTVDRFDRGGGIIGFESVFVDFGNSGALGFGGKYKEESLDRANTEAKKFSEKPKDYDPALAFNAAELALIEAKARELLGGSDQANISPGYSSSADAASSSTDLDDWAMLSHGNNTPLSPAPQDHTQWKTKITEAINALVAELVDNAAAPGKRFSKDEIEIRRSIRFKAAHHILPHEAGIGVVGGGGNGTETTTGLLTFSDLPRNLPFGKTLLKRALQTKTRVAMGLENSADNFSFLKAATPEDAATERGLEGKFVREQKPLHLQSSFYRDSEIEMAFRLSLIPDSAIEHVVKKWYLCKEFPNVFPLPEKFKDDPRYATTGGVVQIFKERRDVLIESIPSEIVAEWCEKNKAQALAAAQEVELAILKKTTNPNPNFDIGAIEISEPDSSVTTGSAASSSAHPAEKIAHQIKRHEAGIANGENALKVRAEIEELRAEMEETTRPKTKQILQEKIELMTSGLEQEQTRDMLDFINANIQKWKSDLGLDSKPNCSLFNLNRMKEIYRVERGISNPYVSADRAMTREEMEQIHATNLFAYRSFMEIIAELSPPALTTTPSTNVSHSTISSATQTAIHSTL